MLIIGAKGFAKEVLEVFNQLQQTDNIAFYDDVNDDVGDLLFDKFQILKNEEQVKAYFKATNNDFTIGIGNPFLRYKLCEKFEKLGGNLSSSISPLAMMSNFEVVISEGCNILMNTVFSNDIFIGKGTLIYYNAVITHDCHIGNFVEISPSVVVLGRCKIGDFTQIGANSTILPDIKIGKNVTIGAGSLVTKDMPDNAVAYGSPAKIIKFNEPLILA